MINGYEINGGVINGGPSSPAPQLGVAASLHRSLYSLDPGIEHHTVARLHRSFYTLQPAISGSITAIHRTSYAIRASVSAAHRSRYGLLAPVAALHSTVYSLDAYNPVSVAFDLPAPFGLERSFELVYHLVGTVQAAFNLVAPLSVSVERSWSLPYDLVDGAVAQRAFSVVYSLIDGAPLIGSDTITAIVDDEAIELADESSIWMSEGDGLWKGTLVLAHPGDAHRFHFNKALVVSFCGMTFNVMVDTKQVSRTTPAGTKVSVGVVSPAAIHRAPRAARVSRVYDEDQSARTIVEGLIGPVEWRIQDWLIPANRLGMEDATPMDVVDRIMEATGAVIESYPDGTLYVRYRFEVPLEQYPTTTPDHVFTEQDDLFSVDEQNEYYEIADRFRITDIEATFGDRIEFEPDDNSGLAGQLHAFPSPWRAFELFHTGPLAVSLSAGVERLIEKEQQIEIVNGAGTLGYPIHSIDDVEWEVVDLGGLSFAPGSTTVQAALADGTSLCTVRYTTRAMVYETSAPQELAVQFAMRDIEVIE